METSPKLASNYEQVFIRIGGAICTQLLQQAENSIRFPKET